MAGIQVRVRAGETSMAVFRERRENKAKAIQVVGLMAPGSFYGRKKLPTVLAPVPAEMEAPITEMESGLKE